MKKTLIRYKTAPERAQENQELIEKVFAELKAKSPDGVRYMVLRLADGTFLHFVGAAEDRGSAITGLDAFKSFQSGVKARCIDGPHVSEAFIVGNYGMHRE